MYNRKAIMQVASALYRSGLSDYQKWSDALAFAWKSTKAAILKAKMLLGEVAFSFTKKDGSLRKAKGTLSPSVIAQYPFTGKQTESPNLVRFFDVEISEWRCFDVARIGKIF
jgi:hypothetical protein